MQFCGEVPSLAMRAQALAVNQVLEYAEVNSNAVNSPANKPAHNDRIASSLCVGTW
jgi:hypothetical protein